MVVLYIVFGLLTVLVYFKFIKRNESKGKEIPGPKGIPLLGKALEISMENIHIKLGEYARQYGDIVRIKVGGETLISMNSLDLIQKAFTEHPYKPHLNDRPEYYYGRTFVNGSRSMGFTQNAFNGPHSALRKSHIRGFNVYGDGIKTFEENITKEITALIDRLDAREGEDIEMIDVVKKSIANVMTYLLSGDQMTDEEFRNISDFLSCVEAFLNFHTNAVLNTFPFLVRVPGYYKTIYDLCMESKAKLVERYVKQIKETRVPGTLRGMVDFFLDEQHQERTEGKEVIWTDDQIVGNVMDLFAAGIDTTLSVMSNTLLCLAHHPEHQSKLQEELDRVLGSRDTTRPPVLADRRNCPYLEAVIMESTRYIPALPLLQIHTTKHDMEFEGYHLPANSMIIPNAWHVLHDEAVWGDPWRFRPDRFLDKDGHLLSATHPLRKHWIPFGIGRRSCVAEQFARSRLFLFLASLVHRYKFTPSPGKGGACDPRGGTFDFTIVCRSKPFYCRIEKRHLK